METLGGGLQQYSKLAYIDTGIREFSDYETLSAEKASQNGWIYEKLSGSCILLQKLLDGDWSASEFVVVQPDQAIQPTYDAEILAAKKVM